MNKKEQHHDKDTSLLQDIKDDDVEEQAKKQTDMSEGNGKVRIM